MTIKEARKILGKLALKMNDKDVLLEIESATLLKDLFFKFYREGKSCGSIRKWKN